MKNSMKNSRLRNTENIDFSRPRAYNDLKIGEVYESVFDGPRKEAVADG